MSQDVQVYQAHPVVAPDPAAAPGETLREHLGNAMQLLTHAEWLLADRPADAETAAIGNTLLDVHRRLRLAQQSIDATPRALADISTLASAQGEKLMAIDTATQDLNRASLAWVAARKAYRFAAPNEAELVRLEHVVTEAYKARTAAAAMLAELCGVMRPADARCGFVS